MIERVLIPSSNWIYFKIYTGTKSADKILREIVKPYVNALVEDNAINEYFFLRYSDPNFHIRLRLSLKDENSFNSVFQNFNKYFSERIENGLIWNIQLDTYKREIERYGSATMESCECYFAVDSQYTIELLDIIDTYTNSEELRWLSGLGLLDDMLDLFCPTLEDKKERIKRISNGFCKEHGIETAKFFKPLKTKYRENKKIIEEFLEHEYKNEEVLDVLKRRKESLKSITDEIIDGAPINTNISAEYILTSLIHMTMNRLFRANNRLCETVEYFLLTEYYTSVIARSKK